MNFRGPLPIPVCHWSSTNRKEGSVWPSDQIDGHGGSIVPSAVGEGEEIEEKKEEGRCEGGIKPRRSWGREPGKLMKASGRRIGSISNSAARH